jgi:hypothetical protein
MSPARPDRARAESRSTISASCARLTGALSDRPADDVWLVVPSYGSDGLQKVALTLLGSTSSSGWLFAPMI